MLLSDVVAPLMACRKTK